MIRTAEALCAAAKRTEAKHAAAAEREVRRILRAADKRIAVRRPPIYPLMTAAEVCRLFGFTMETLRRRIETGKLPPPCNKAISAPANPILREVWQREHRRWNRKLLEAISWGIMPPVIHTFQEPQDWVDFLIDHKDFAL